MLWTFIIRVVSSTLALISIASSAPRQTTGLSVEEAISRYASGDFDIAVRDLDTRRLTFAPFVAAIDNWISAGDPASEPRRHLTAVAFAFDSTWAATRTFHNGLEANHDPWKSTFPDDPQRILLSWYPSQGLVAEWAAQRLPTTGATSEIERLLWLTSVGIAEDGHAWHRLSTEVLPRARRRFGFESRLRLAEVLARTTSDVGSLRESAARRNDILRDERLPSSVTGRIPAVERALAALLPDASLEGEIELRLGYLELRQRHWDQALQHLDVAAHKSSEPTLRAAADYFAGWIHETQGRPDGAIAAYRRGLAIAPTMRNLATRLSALLFLNNERVEGYRILDAALNARPAPVDLLVVVERADARFVPDWLISIRKALQ